MARIDLSFGGKFSFFLALLSGIACDQALAAPGAPPPVEIPVVVAKKLERKPLFDVLSYPARVHPRVVAAVLAESDGVVRKVFRPLGTSVKRGERLLEIRNTDPVYQYAAAYARAPVAGVVSQLNVREGSHVTKNQEVLIVTDPTDVSVQVEIAAIDLETLKAGDRGELQINGEDFTRPVEILGISPFVNPGTGTATCELKISREANAAKNKTPRARPGLVGQVIFRANERKSMVVPDHAIFYKDGQTFLRIIDSANVARQVLVVTGRKQQGQVEILRGVDEGQNYIERSSRFVGDGQTVKVDPPKEAKAEEAA